MSRTKATYTRPTSLSFMDVSITPAAVKDGSLVERFNTRRYPSPGVTNSIDSTTVLAVTPASPQVAATVLTLTATVSLSQGDGVLAGTVAFKKDGTVFATVPVFKGVAKTTTTLAVGAHNLTAVFSGRGDAGDSTSNTVAQTAS